MSKLALYIHWPFCLSKCPYCDFNSHVREKVEETLWEQAFLLELERLFELTGPRILTSIFFGGGTPSLMNPKTVGTIIEKATQLYQPLDPLEVTLEANPSTAEIGRFQDFRDVGVNRLSLGVQSFSQAALVFLGRRHGCKEAIQAIEWGVKIFPRTSFDLIYALPDQDKKSWRKELKQALVFGTEHLSLYQLTIEPGTAFARRYEQGRLKVIDEEKAATFYEMTQEILDEAGLPAYEISNHARIGKASSHNLSYWRYQDYGGIGPGAHGRLTCQGKKLATQQIRSPENWLAHVLEQGTGDEVVEELSPKIQALEALMMGLRLVEGLFIKDLAFPLSEIINEKALKWLEDHDFLQREDEKLKATSKGRQCLNSVLEMLVA